MEKSKSACVFCNFKDREVLIYSDDLCYASIDKNPINKYHILVIPKKHYEKFTELPDKLSSHIFIVVKKISKAVRKACKPDAITHISDDDYSDAGYNLVPHFKVHIIPRFKDDLKKINWAPLRKSASLRARAKFASKVRSYLE